MLEFVTAAEIFGGPSLENDQAAGRAVVRYAALDTPEDVARETAGADGIIITTHPFGADHIAALGPRVRVIGRAGIGLDAIDLRGRRGGRRRRHQLPRLRHERGRDPRRRDAARAAPAARRGRPSGPRAVGRAVVARRACAPLESLTLGLVGLGRIGRAMAERMRPLVGAIQAYDPASPAAARRRVALRLPRRAARVERPRLAAPAVAAGDREAARRRAVRAHALRGSAGERLARCADRRGRPRRRHWRQVRSEARHSTSSRASRSRRIARILAAPNTLLSPHVAWFSTASGPKVRRDTVEAMIVWIESGTVPHGNLAARPARSRDEATAEGVS